MAFVRTIPPSAAEGAVREMYEETHRQLGLDLQQPRPGSAVGADGGAPVADPPA